MLTENFVREFTAWLLDGHYPSTPATVRTALDLAHFRLPPTTSADQLRSATPPFRRLWEQLPHPAVITLLTEWLTAGHHFSDTWLEDPISPPTHFSWHHLPEDLHALLLTYFEERPRHIVTLRHWLPAPWVHDHLVACYRTPHLTQTIEQDLSTFLSPGDPVAYHIASDRTIGYTSREHALAYLSSAQVETLATAWPASKPTYHQELIHCPAAPQNIRATALKACVRLGSCSLTPLPLFTLDELDRITPKGPGWVKFLIHCLKHHEDRPRLQTLPTMDWVHQRLLHCSLLDHTTTDYWAQIRHLLNNRDVWTTFQTWFLNIGAYQGLLALTPQPIPKEMAAALLTAWLTKDAPPDTITGWLATLTEMGFHPAPPLSSSMSSESSHDHSHVSLPQ